MNTEIKFGPAGANQAFLADKKNSLIMFPKYISSFDLNAFEFQCGHGVRTNKDFAEKFKTECVANSIYLSIHSPYYISLSSIDPQKRINSVNYILQTAQLADIIGAKRIVVHSGSCSKISREKALSLASETLKQALETLFDNKLDHITLCPEVMGKTNQLGTLSEVIELCNIHESVIPCVDFGHLNARSFGELNSEKSFESVFNEIENHLGEFRAKNMHIHFSKIEYSSPGGERRHLTFDDKIYGPSFEHLANIIIKKSATPVIICESSGTQVEDAVTMKSIYNSLLAKNSSN